MASRDHARRRRGIEPVTILMMMMIVVSCAPSMSMAQGTSNVSTATTNSTTSFLAVKVGVILNLKTLFGKMGLSSIRLALSDCYAANPHYATRLVFETRDSDSDVVAAAASALDLIKNEQVQAILGPETSMENNFVIQLGNKAKVPILTFSAKSPSLASLRSPYFFRIAANDSAQVGAIAAVVKAFGWRQVVPIYVDNEYGDGVIPYLTDALQSVDARVPYRSVIPPEASDDFIAAELYNLMTMSTRVFVLHMLPDLGARIFSKADQIGMMGKGYVWIVTDGMALFFVSANSSAVESMQGVLGVKTYVPRSEKLNSFSIRWRTEFRRENPTILDPPPMVVFGLWAYDAVFALAMAVEETSNATRFGFVRTNSSRNSTDLDSFSVSQSGAALIGALSRTRFRGLSGDFRLLNGQLQTLTFEILNVNGSGEKRLGFWSLETGLTKVLNSTKTTSVSTLESRLGSIVWPGDETSPPKGWQIPTNTKVLRIGVPVKHGFEEFVKVTRQFSNATVSGYCIDVFKAVLEEMPYSVAFEFVPFVNAQVNGSYDDLVYQVFLENYNAAVGDVTIRANRSTYVDFTLPFTESGISMIVPNKDENDQSGWVFFTPLTLDLWLTILASFIIIGVIVWALEHRDQHNPDFKGPPWYQILTGLWYSFSTMVFGHREKVKSTWTRFLVVVWCFAVLILTQSYTASLTSRLTIEQLRPTVTDVNQLITKRAAVGFQKGSFIKGLLEEMGFDESQFKVYSSPDELHTLFENGRGNGGIVAAFDESPYMKLFIAKYCSKYAMVEPTFKADGFGFVFPKNSPLVPDVSRGILKVQEGKQIKDIEAVWFKEETNCPDPRDRRSSFRLSFKSFKYLFIGVAVAAGIVSIGGLSTFIYKERAVLYENASFPVKIAKLWRRFLAYEEDAQANPAAANGSGANGAAAADGSGTKGAPGANGAAPADGAAAADGSGTNGAPGANGAAPADGSGENSLASNSGGENAAPDNGG